MGPGDAHQITPDHLHCLSRLVVFRDFGASLVVHAGAGIGGSLLLGLFLSSLG